MASIRLTLTLALAVIGCATAGRTPTPVPPASPDPARASSAASSQPADEPSKAQSELQARILRLPPWTAMELGTAAPVLLTGYEELCATTEPGDLRAAIDALLSRPREDEDGWTRLETQVRVLVLLRVYFAVPEWAPSPEHHAWGGFVGCPVRDGRLGLLWPLLRRDDGRLAVGHKFLGYNGAPYDGVGEFDAFARSFERRAVRR